MDISAASAIKSVDVRNKISVAVARKTLDAAQQQGAAAIELLRAAAQTGKAAGHGGVGDRLDVAG